MLTRDISNVFSLSYVFDRFNWVSGEGFHTQNIILYLVVARGGTPNPGGGTLFCQHEIWRNAVPPRFALYFDRGASTGGDGGSVPQNLTKGGRPCICPPHCFINNALCLCPSCRQIVHRIHCGSADCFEIYYVIFKYHPRSSWLCLLYKGHIAGCLVVLLTVRLKLFDRLLFVIHN